MMTEQEMAYLLGIVVEPVENRVQVDSRLRAEIHDLKQAFMVLTPQKNTLSTLFDPDSWARLVPWHSLN